MSAAPYGIKNKYISIKLQYLNPSQSLITIMLIAYKTNFKTQQNDSQVSIPINVKSLFVKL